MDDSVIDVKAKEVSKHRTLRMTSPDRSTVTIIVIVFVLTVIYNLLK